ncbi:hypothetical protein K470DRAFT_100339 [Piedraia hortae CBS 480.64]|uniref:Uncharacterized protein n=1 Tax=Piedraia hortae CBS 480.64 TaxID=1314780 RepID=A0A6A7BW67_9PEZI|nr:hypothetical protein K470DRAFT_100339 [Piedraia hortae CBS 480.64]
MMPKSGKVINFPWHRPMDFKKAYSEAAWDIKEYHQMHFRDMAITREKNKPRLAAIDKGQSKCGPHANYSAKFVFLNKTSEANAKALGYNTVDEVIKAAQSGKLHFDTCKYIELCWKSKNDAGELYQAGFPAWDTLITRQQLRHRPILTTCAAECIIDFCPDLLHGDTLLRIVSEAGYDPKMLRDRYCLNGCMADVNMFTDRVVSALGISREPRSTADELWVCNNMDQFNQYCLFLNSKPWHFSALLPRRQNGASEIPAGKQVIEIDD